NRDPVGGHMRQLLFLALVLFSLALVGSCTPANATPVGASVAISQALPAVGPGYSDSFDFSCTTSPAVFVSGALSYECRVAREAAARVRIGDAGITTTSGGPTYDADERFGGNLKAEWCVSESGTVEI